jgi:hypothetical protein
MAWVYRLVRWLREQVDKPPTPFFEAFPFSGDHRPKEQSYAYYKDDEEALEIAFVHHDVRHKRAMDSPYTCFAATTTTFVVERCGDDVDADLLLAELEAVLLTSDDVSMQHVLLRAPRGRLLAAACGRYGYLSTHLSMSDPRSRLMRASADERTDALLQLVAGDAGDLAWSTPLARALFQLLVIGIEDPIITDPKTWRHHGGVFNYLRVVQRMAADSDQVYAVGLPGPLFQAETFVATGPESRTGITTPILPKRLVVSQWRRDEFPTFPNVFVAFLVDLARATASTLVLSPVKQLPDRVLTLATAPTRFAASGSRDHNFVYPASRPGYGAWPTFERVGKELVHVPQPYHRIVRWDPVSEYVVLDATQRFSIYEPPRPRPEEEEGVGIIDLVSESDEPPPVGIIDLVSESSSESEVRERLKRRRQASEDEGPAAKAARLRACHWCSAALAADGLVVTGDGRRLYCSWTHALEALKV